MMFRCWPVRLCCSCSALLQAIRYGTLLALVELHPADAMLAKEVEFGAFECQQLNCSFPADGGLTDYARYETKDFLSHTLPW